MTRFRLQNLVSVDSSASSLQTLSSLVHKYLDGRQWCCPSWNGIEYLFKISQFMDNDERKVALVPLLDAMEVHRRAIANTKPTHSQEIIKTYERHGSAVFLQGTRTSIDFGIDPIPEAEFFPVGVL